LVLRGTRKKVFFFAHNTGNIWFSEARRCRSVQHYRISPVRKILRVETCTFFSQAETIVWVLAHKLVSRPKWRVDVFLLFDFFRRRGFFFLDFQIFQNQCFISHFKISEECDRVRQCSTQSKKCWTNYLTEKSQFLTR
jgi:hypothetical protein